MVPLHPPHRHPAPAPHSTLPLISIADCIAALPLPAGCGFIGRNLATYLLDNELAQEIRLADKTPPQMAWLNEEQTRVFESDRVEFCSANLINAGR